jgi:glycosyltransferase involved in cell wall biosynthesis
LAVIIPVFNGAHHVRDARASIEAQQYPGLEVIVVDDGSTDDTAAIVNEPGFATRVIHQENAGAAAARNRGIEASTADLIAFLDADDLWPAGKLALQVDALEQEPSLDVVLGRIKIVTLDGARMPDLDFEDRDEHTVASVHLGGAVFRRRAFDRVGRFDESLRYSEDHDWFLRARELQLRMRLLPEVTLVYRFHDHSMTRSGAPRDFDMARVIKKSLDRRRAAGERADLGRWLDLDPVAGARDLGPCDLERDA